MQISRITTQPLFKLKLDNSKLSQTIKKLSDSNNSIHFYMNLLSDTPLISIARRTHWSLSIPKM
jgi:hypothetical protein